MALLKEQDGAEVAFQATAIRKARTHVLESILPMVPQFYQSLPALQTQEYRGLEILVITNFNQSRVVASENRDLTTTTL